MCVCACVLKGNVDWMQFCSEDNGSDGAVPPPMDFPRSTRVTWMRAQDDGNLNQYSQSCFERSFLLRYSDNKVIPSILDSSWWLQYFLPMTLCMYLKENTFTCATTYHNLFIPYPWFKEIIHLPFSQIYIHSTDCNWQNCFLHRPANSANITWSWIPLGFMIHPQLECYPSFRGYRPYCRTRNHAISIDDATTLYT